MEPKTLRLMPSRYTWLTRRLGHRNEIANDALRASLNNIASAYYRLLIGQATERTRADDRGAHLELAVLSCSVSKQLKSLHNALPSPTALMPPIPAMSGRAQWLRNLGSNLSSLAAELEKTATGGLSDAPCDELRHLSVELQQLSKALSNLDNDARVHPMYTLAKTVEAPHFEGWTGSLNQAVRRVAYATLRARNRRMWKAERGPVPRNALRLLAEDLYRAMKEALGEPLALSVHDKTRSYSGAPGNDDTRFLLEFVDWVHRSIPEEIRKARPTLFVSSAIFDAYKETSERVNRANKLPA